MNRIAINDAWQFVKLPGCFMQTLREAAKDSPAWPQEIQQRIGREAAETICLPHTWYRDEDAYRGLTMYEKEVTTDPAWECLFVDIPAADQQALVFADGMLIADHKGGYSAFRGEVPERLIRAGHFTLRIFVSNEANNEISPLAGDFAVYGGLYRGVNLLVAAKTHFDYLYFGTNGVTARTSLTENTGKLFLTPHVKAPEGVTAAVRYTLLDGSGEVQAQMTGCPEEETILEIGAPHRWDGKKDPYLYTLRAELLSGGQVSDCSEEHVGFRSVSLSADSGFYLNGRNLRINGVACHHDLDGVFNAKREQDIDRDFTLIGEIGANALRLSHYQHPQRAYDLADRNGYLVWAEIPMLKLPPADAVLENAKQQLTELILQNLHHPSVFCWGIQNEIGMYGDAPYMYDALRELKEEAKRLDPERPVAGANLYTVKAGSGLNAATDMVGYNIYFGWYYGKMQDYDAFLDKLHEKRPRLPLGISEYGVDASPKLHSADPKVRDYSEEYQALFHETVYPIFKSKPYLWGTFVWNLFDFASPMRREGGCVNRNQKGLVTFDRKIRKDAFYYYKAQWSDEPFIHICSRRFVHRTESAITVRLYTNQTAVSLMVNGVSFGERTNDGNGAVVFENVPLREGKNRIEAVNGALHDACEILRTDTPDASYTLPDSGAGKTVRNWFLADDDIVREGYYSIKDTANDLLADARSRAVIECFAPDLFRLMTTRDVVPLGLPLQRILSRNSDGIDQKALNEALNQIPAEE